MDVITRMLMKVPEGTVAPCLAIRLPLEGRVGLTLECRPAEVSRLMTAIHNNEEKAGILRRALEAIHSYAETTWMLDDEHWNEEAWSP